MNEALLLVDIQNDYFDGGAFPLHQPDKAATQAAKILSRFRQSNKPVIHVQHISLKEGAIFFLPDTKGCEIHPLVTPIPGESVVIKHAPNSFFQTDLLALLNEKEIDHLVICGMMSHMCIDTTARAAKEHIPTITIIEDACTTRDLPWKGTLLPAPDVHNAIMASLSGTFGTVMGAEEYLGNNKMHV